MSKLGMPKTCRFEVVYNGQTHNFEDPNGWENIKTILSRNENFGINSEVSADELKFPHEIYDLFRQAYYAKGQFAEAKINVYVRNESWEEELYQVYDVDFSTYSDDSDYVSVQLISNTLIAKLNANFDTEYDIALDPDNNSFLDYRSSKVASRNELSFQFGATYELPFGSLLKGIRNDSTRAYDSDLSFYKEGTEEYYGFMEARALNNITSMDVEVSLNIKAFSTGGACFVEIFSFDANGANPIMLKSFTPVMTGSMSVFNYEKTTFQVDLASGRHIGMFIVTGAGGRVFIPDSNSNGLGTYMAFSKQSVYGKNGKSLSVFTFDWLFSQLLKKIDENAVFINNVTNQHITHVLSSSDCMRMIGQNATGTVKTSFKDTLKAFHVLECVGLDITGNVVTINPLSEHYINEKSIDIECNELIIEHDTEHTFNTFRVGCTKSSDSENGNYAFNTEKTFGIQDNRSFSQEKGNELDLLCPFITDQFTIDKKILDYANETGKADSGKDEIVVFACENNNNSSDWFSSEGIFRGDFNTGTVRLYADTIERIEWKTILVENNTPNSSSNEPYFDGVHTHSYYVYGNITFNIEIYGRGFSHKPIVTYSHTTGGVLTELSKIENFIDDDYYYKSNIEITTNHDGIFILDFDIPTNEENTSVELSYKFSGSQSLNEIYRQYTDHIINNYKGDIETSYNIPYTPKRILNKHLPYISISNYYSEKTLKYVSGDNNSNILSKLAYENEFVDENDEIQTISPLFLPVKVTFNFDGDLDKIKSLKINKYKYIKTVYRGKEYTLWISDLGIQLGRQSQQEVGGYLRSYDL